ncbi:MAG TPA: RagB/SusD family nutrient uptake outer membrane protein [Gemmatimonadota bacterium]|nr:RagB/SusD family nutrient uptake outer membrane protein [Gemmatimonadota bacterium]
MRHSILGRASRVLAVAALVGLAACKGLETPNYNGGDLGALQNSPDRASLAAAVQGLQIGHRGYQSGELGVVSALGVLGRESYVLDVADPRFVNELLQGPLNAGGFGAGLWAAPYSNIRLANIVLDGVASVGTDQMTDGEKAATVGFVKTIQALDFLVVVETRWDNCDGSLGCPIDVGTDVDQGPAPAATKDEVFAHIKQLLDDADQELQAAASAGAGFPFDLSSGFDGFDTPADFDMANRAIAARVDVYTDAWSDALTALSQSFVDSAATFDLGIYDVYGTGSGDATNGLYQPSDDPNIRANPFDSLAVQYQTSGDPDARYMRKIREITQRSFSGPGSHIGFDMYTSLDAPIPIIRNEELILLRAEANIGLGNLDLARQDINWVRTQSGNLPPIATAFANHDEALDALLYEKHYSLLFEGGHRWIDLRHYGLLTDPNYAPQGSAYPNESYMNTQYPIPLDEQNARQ